MQERNAQPKTLAFFCLGGLAVLLAGRSGHHWIPGDYAIVTAGLFNLFVLMSLSMVSTGQ